MTDNIITLAQVKASDLSIQSQIILQARQSKALKDHSPESLDKFARTLIAETLFRMGQKNITEELVLVAVTDLTEGFGTHFQNWTPEEIRLACKMGALGELGGEDFSLSSRVVFKWLKLYSENIRPNAHKELQKAQSREARRLLHAPQNDTPQAACEFLDICFERWKDSGHIVTSAFMTAERMGLITMTLEEKAQEMGLALERVTATIRGARRESTMARELSAGFMRSLEALIPGDFKTYPPSVASEARRGALESLFQNCDFDDVKPSEMIKK